MGMNVMARVEFLYDTTLDWWSRSDDQVIFAYCH